MQYTDKNRTPLSFHKFFRFIACPLAFFSSLRTAALAFGNLGLSPLMLIDLIYSLASAALLTVCFAGFFRWAGYAWVCCMAYILLTGIYEIIIMLLSLPSSSGPVAEIFVRLCSLAAIFCMYLYYRKRKLLFDGSRA